jgi:hypothetical protein
MYNKIYEFCKIRNIGTVYSNEPNNPTPRVKFILDLLDSEGIDYVLDEFKPDGNRNGRFSKSSELSCYNVILKGDSNKMVVAHHDIVNPNIDNANDNSASVINAIMIKRLMPSMNIVLLDGEEVGGLGSQRVSDQINEGYFGEIEWVLNLELTGKGGKYFFVGNYPGPLQSRIIEIFNCPIVETPYNDSVTFRKNGIDSCVINPIPPVNNNNNNKSNVRWDDNTYLDFTMLFNCHTSRDTLDTIDINDMKEFVEDVVLKILS